MAEAFILASWEPLRMGVAREGCVSVMPFGCLWEMPQKALDLGAKSAVGYQ